MADEKKMPFTAHLEELRQRLILICIAIAIGFGLSYTISDKIILFLQRPMQDQKLIFLAPTEAFFVNLKAAFFAGLFFTAPFTFLQLWLFVAPGLLEHEKRFALPFLLCSSVAFLIGATFGYFLILPLGLQFLLSQGQGIWEPSITLSNYISFASKLLIAFGMVFEIPLVVLLLSKFGLITPAFLSKNRKYILLLCFVFGAILTPPDVVTQALLALPMYLLFELSVFISKVVYRQRAASEARG
ncbi:MAG: twin-arginine translocase subunit TatC [Nitrospinota bacterium]|nr:MAG: twin-arginine translocase subunit TatC [Nitrospinota bacterium]